MGVYHVTWSLSGVDAIRWGLQSVSMWRPPVTVRRTTLEVPGRHGVIAAGLPVFEEPTVSLTMWVHGSTQDDIEAASMELLGLLSAPDLTLTRTSGNHVASAPAVLVSVGPDEFTTAAEATFEVVLAVPGVFLRGLTVDSTLTTSGAVPGLTGSTGPVGDALLRVADPEGFTLTDDVSGTGISWAGSMPGWFLYVDMRTLRAWLSADPEAWSPTSGDVVRTNIAAPPRPIPSQSLSPVRLLGTAWGDGAGTMNVVGTDADGVAAARCTTAPTSLQPGSDLIASSGTITAAGGRWYGFGIQVGSAGLVQDYSPSLVWIGSGEPATRGPSYTVGALQWIEFVAQAPSGTTSVRADLDYGDNPVLWDVGDGLDVRKLMIFEADTQAEVQAALDAGYFDGDTPDTVLQTNAWTADPYISNSTQTTHRDVALSLLDYPATGRLQLWPRMPGTNPAERTARVTYSGASEVVVRARPAYL